MVSALKQLGAQVGGVVAALIAMNFTAPYMVMFLWNNAEYIPAMTPQIGLMAFVLTPGVLVGSLAGWGLARLAHKGG